VSETVGLPPLFAFWPTFCMQSLTRLRAFAIVSNLLFIVYAASADLLPILLLHTVLLPINGWSLAESLVVVQLQS
jgi:CRP/FNR family cyclic AMP-dependent transcriptional regulator